MVGCPIGRTLSHKCAKQEEQMDNYLKLPDLREIQNRMPLDEKFQLSTSMYSVRYKQVVIAEYINRHGGTFAGFEKDIKKHVGNIRYFRTVGHGNKLIETSKVYRTLAKKGIVVSPSHPLIHNDYEQAYVYSRLYDDIVDYLKSVLFLNCEYEYHAVALYVIMTWHFDKFDSLPYLRFIGDFGTGKSTALKAVGNLTYRSVLTSGAVTASTIFRLCEKVKGTFYIDESDFASSDMKNGLIKILNSGYTRGFPVMRTGQKFEPGVFEVFGPKVIGAREQFNDDALESRCMTISMYPNRRSVKAVDSLLKWEEATELRNRLLGMRLVNYINVIEEDHERWNKRIKDKNWEPRVRQIAFPLMFIGEKIERSEGIKMFDEISKDFDSLRQGTIQAELVRAYLNVSARNRRASLNHIRSALGDRNQKAYPNRRLGGLLRRMGFDIVRSNTGSYAVIDDRSVEKLRLRYNINTNQQEKNREETENLAIDG